MPQLNIAMETIQHRYKKHVSEKRKGILKKVAIAGLLVGAVSLTVFAIRRNF